MNTKTPYEEYKEQFKQKLKIGQKYEEIAIKKIVDKYNVELVKRQEDNKYDFKTSDRKTYEVKADLRSATSKNFFIEYEGFGKPTGIDITKARYHILTDGDSYHMIRTRLLKELIRNNNYYSFTMNDISHTKGYIIPKGSIIELSELL